MRYDIAAGIAAFALAVTALADDDGWSVASAGRGSEIMLALGSTDGIPDESGRETVYPSLEFHCAPGAPDSIGIRIDWRRFISSFSTEVGFKAGDGKRNWLKLGVDASNRVTLAKEGADTTALLELFATGAPLSVEVSPYSEGPVTVRFDLTGYADAVEELRAACR